MKTIVTETIDELNHELNYSFEQEAQEKNVPLSILKNSYIRWAIHNCFPFLDQTEQEEKKQRELDMETLQTVYEQEIRILVKKKHKKEMVAQRLKEEEEMAAQRLKEEEENSKKIAEELLREEEESKHNKPLSASRKKNQQKKKKTKRKKTKQQEIRRSEQINATEEQIDAAKEHTIKEWIS